jgi:intracellular sulfur oxidation DsrE/DsrF family protein
MKQFIAATVLAAAAALGIVPLSQAIADQAVAAKPAKKYQLVFHVSENNPQQWQLALNNAFAFQKNVGKDNADVEIVAIGPGLNMLKLDSKVADRISGALDHNIDVVACGETMAATKVTAADLIGGVRVVPGGLIEIADRQHAGWVYIRP